MDTKLQIKSDDPEDTANQSVKCSAGKVKLIARNYLKSVSEIGIQKSTNKKWFAKTVLWKCIFNLALGPHTNLHTNSCGHWRS